ncbi:hypothetical protein BpHYR1_027053 [Brachionus plicatilis]|uniref:Uncharacterized protein n=1 Tax=Brachionus plicatilis TaxID=10195 RepID=A0A3M7Q8X7_BRAPC|nr:hypothetical protein BpHYR1_027053 [Brachionus plicatilis]
MELSRRAINTESFCSIGCQNGGGIQSSFLKVSNGLDFNLGLLSNSDFFLLEFIEYQKRLSAFVLSIFGHFTILWPLFHFAFISLLRDFLGLACYRPVIKFI